MDPFAAAPETSATFLRGVRLHNAGAFFEAHEAWEELWRAEVDEARRRFLQGLIQVAAAFHKLFVQRAPGSAQALLERGLTKLDPYPREYLGVALGEFRDAARAWIPRIADHETHPAGIAADDRTTLPQLRLASEE